MSVILSDSEESYTTEHGFNQVISITYNVF
jgi:hypothetical protein